MKTKLALFIIASVISGIAAAQTNYSTTLPNGQEARNMFGTVCCSYRANIATDAEGNAYVLSEIPADSSIWVTKYDYNGTQLFNTRVGVLGYETDHRYFAKKIRVYGDRVYVLSTTIFNYLPNDVYQTVYIVERNTGALFLSTGMFAPYFGYTSCELVDLIQDGNTIYLAGNVWYSGGPGSTKIQVNRSDLAWTGNSFLYGNDASTDYYLNTESNCLAMHNGSLYMTGVANYAGSNLKILIGKMDVWGFWSEYKYDNPSYTEGGKGLSIAAEGNSVYVSGAVRAQLNKPFKAAVIKIDSSLTAPAWVTISNKSEWPLAINLSSTNAIYTVDYNLKVVGFSKTTGSQLFAKNDFKNYLQVYNEPIFTTVLNNNQLMIQATVGVKVGGVNTTSKVVVKYSTSGSKVYQQLESIPLIAPGNPGFAQALGLAYSSASNYMHEIYWKNTSLGQYVYVNGKASASSLRISSEEQHAAGSVSIFPNPATDNITIDCGEKIAEWTMYNTLSQSVARGNAGEEETTIDCRNLEAGIYFINIKAVSGEIVTRKITIVR